MQRRNGVVVRFARLVVGGSAALGRLKHAFGIDRAPDVQPGRRELERVQGEPGVAVGEIDQQRSRLVGSAPAPVAEPPVVVRQRAGDDRLDVAVIQRLQAPRPGSGREGAR